MPIDANGCSVDISRTCFRKSIRPWINDPTEVRVRYYRGVAGAPCLNFPHSFGIPDMWDDQPPADLPDGEAGTLPGESRYDRGRLPTVYRPDGSFVGAPKQWLLGSVRGVDPSYTVTRVGSTLQCLSQLGIGLRMHRWGQMVDGMQQ